MFNNKIMFNVLVYEYIFGFEFDRICVGRLV